MNATPEEIANMRRTLARIDDSRVWTDDQLDAAITAARDWIDGRRWSRNVVATNILLDGRASAKLHHFR